ncbi:hypothetical protein ACLBWT_19880 [Paenibacillus sp. D51F]
MSAGRHKPSSPPSARAQHEVDLARGTWSRKPATQVQPNRKKEQRRSWCRKGNGNDAVFLFSRIQRGL